MEAECVKTDCLEALWQDFGICSLRMAHACGIFCIFAKRTVEALAGVDITDNAASLMRARAEAGRVVVEIENTNEV